MAKQSLSQRHKFVYSCNFLREQIKEGNYKIISTEGKKSQENVIANWEWKSPFLKLMKNNLVKHTANTS